MTWTVALHRKAKKQYEALPPRIQDIANALMRSLMQTGPVQNLWPHYGKLDAQRHHCHTKKGRSTYVAVWSVENATIKLIEVHYVGTHEKAPY